jgi:hypothetical protein
MAGFVDAVGAVVGKDKKKDDEPTSTGKSQIRSHLMATLRNLSGSSGSCVISSPWSEGITSRISIGLDMLPSC